MRRSIGLAGALISLSLGPAANGDGRATIGQVAKAYEGIQSCSYAGSATQYTKIGGRTVTEGSSSIVRIRKPNRFYISITGPKTGTLTFACDGRSAVAYNAKTNQYIRRPAGPSIGATMVELNRGAASAFGIAIASAPFDALFFLEGGQPQKGVVWSIKGNASVGGAACEVIVGTLGAGKPFPRATLWVDQATHLLRKTEIVRVIRVVDRRAKKGSPGIMVQVTMTEDMADLRANPPIADSQFQFKPPAGAVEQNLEQYLKK